MKVGVSKSNLHKTLMELIDKQLVRLKYLRGQKKLISQNFAKITFSLSAHLLFREKVQIFGRKYFFGDIF